MLAWTSNTISRPASKQAAAIAMVNAMGNIGSIPGSYIWPAKYGPLYVQSFGAEIAILSFAICVSFVLRTYLKRQNKKLDAQEASDYSALEGKQSEADNQTARGFRYLY